MMVRSLKRYSDDEIRAVRLSQLMEYLVGLGWSRIANYGRNAFLYRSLDGRDVVVPNRESVSDYPRAVNEILRVVSIGGDDDPSAVYHDVRYLQHDVIRVQARFDGDSEGTVAPDAGSALFSEARDLWSEAVSEALGDSAEAKEYWQQARFGQTEHGSYVVTMLSPPVFLRQQLMIASDETAVPPSRKVTNAFKDSLQNAVALVRLMPHDAQAAIERAADRSTSPAAYASIGKTVGQFGSVRYRISETSISPSGRACPTVAEFTRAHGEYLVDASKILIDRGWDQIDNATLNGYILRCERRENSDEGKLTLLVLMADIKGAQTVHMQVDSDAYGQALAWHGEKSRVDVRGKLVQTAKSTWDLREAQIRRSLSEDWDRTTPA